MPQIILDAATLNAWVALLTIAERLGRDLYLLLMERAQTEMTPESWATLQARWNEDAVRAARNAGLDPTTGLPVPAVP